jgi:osmoprotectant transport system permease protein
MERFKMIEYWNDYHTRLIEAMLTHLQLVTISLLIALAIAIGLIFLFVNRPNELKSLTYFFSALYAVPSYAFFALLIPISGLGTTTAIIVLSLYSEYILLRTFSTGIKQIDSTIVGSAVAMGMTTQQVFIKIQLPLAAKSIFSGIRLALTAIIGIATIAATINAGGLGTVLFDGLRTQSLIKISWGTLLTLILCICCNFALQVIEKFCLKIWGLEE